MNKLKQFNIHNLAVILSEEDITKHEADVIVNSANDMLLGEDGVDGAIHIAAGPELQIECNKTGYCAVTDVVVTSAYKLPAKYVFHTVGPQWNDDAELAEALLTLTYFNNLMKAEELGMRSIAFPSISTGQYGIPADIGARSFVAALRRFARELQPKSVESIRMVTYYDPDFDERSDIYEQYDVHLSRLDMPRV